MSTFAGDTANTMLLGLAMYSEMRFLVCFSISVGWSPMGTYIRCQYGKFKGREPKASQD